jgi:hypothetical protein
LCDIASSSTWLAQGVNLAKRPEHLVLGGFGHGGNFLGQERDTRRRIAREGRSVVRETAGMKNQKGGHIINLSSVYGHKGPRRRRLLRDEVRHGPTTACARGETLKTSARP